MSFHKETHVKKTRKTRRCGWCGDLINKGDPSVYTCGVYSNELYEGRYHPECSVAITRYYRAHQCWGEEMPEGYSNRGGISEKGEPEPYGFCVWCHKASTTTDPRCPAPDGDGHLFKPLA